MTVSTVDSADLLHSLGYIYLRMGHHKRALVMLLLANRVAPENIGILRTLTSAFLENDSPQRAIGALDRLSQIDPDGDAVIEVLRVRALWKLGDKDEARRRFQLYLSARSKT